MSSGEDDDVVSASVPHSLKKSIRIEAARQDRPMADVIRDALHDWAERNGIEPPEREGDGETSDATADD